MEIFLEYPESSLCSLFLEIIHQNVAPTVHNWRDTNKFCGFSLIYQFVPSKAIIDEQSNIYGFPRPLEDFYVIQPYNNDINIPIIGSFGFATFGKSWYKIVEETQKDFEEAIIRFNIPFATYIPDN